MKLALISDSYPPSRTSAAVQLRDLTRELYRQGHEVTVLLPNSELERPWNLIYSEGAKIVQLKSPPTKDLGYVRRTINEFLMPYAMRRNLKHSQISQRNWDGVIWYSPSIFHAPLVRMLKRESGCRGYLVIRDIFPEWAVDLGLIRKGLTYYFLKAIARHQYKTADIIGVQTEGNIAYFESWRESGTCRSLEVLHNWLGQPATARCQIRVDQTALSGRKIIVYAGNMGIAQGMDVLIDLAFRFKSRSDVGFLFVGRGSETQRLNERAKSLALNNVLFHDEIDPDEIPGLYSQCTAGVVMLDPRHKSHNIPGKFLTYMQSGLPVFASLNPGNDLAELITRHNVGRVCKSTSLDELEETLCTLLEMADNDPFLPERCTHLFKSQFSVSQASQQIVSALSV